MPTIQHRDIPNAQLHEPKGIVSALTKQMYVANGAGSGAWRRPNEADLDYTDKTKNVFGWNDISDSLYTLGSPRAISATTRTQLTNNALAATTDTSRLGTIWDTALNQFLINDLNASYILKANMKVKAAAAAGTPYIIKLDLESATGPTVVVNQDFTIKGGGYENGISLTALQNIYSGINNAALKLYVTADTAITLYSIQFLIQRVYKET